MKVMKIVAAATTVFAVCHAAEAYDNKVVHANMTGVAFDAAAAQNGFIARLGLSGKTIATLTPRIALQQGAIEEDQEMLATKTAFHFMDPVNLLPLRIVEKATCTTIFQSPLTAADWALSSSLNDHGLARKPLHNCA
jgi:hypothetical protein